MNADRTILTPHCNDSKGVVSAITASILRRLVVHWDRNQGDRGDVDLVR